jgi:hypothetical protein
MADKKESGGGFDKTTDFKWFGIGLLVFLLIWVMPTPESMLLKAKELFGDLSPEEIERKAFQYENHYCSAWLLHSFLCYKNPTHASSCFILLDGFNFFLELQSQKMA